MSYDTDYFNQEEIDFLNFIAKATRSNQLFLTNAVQLNMVKLRPLYDWFESKLTVISPKEALQKPPCQAGWNKNVLFGFS